MPFFTRGALFHTSKRSPSPKPTLTATAPKSPSTRSPSIDTEPLPPGHAAVTDIKPDPESKPKVEDSKSPLCPTDLCKESSKPGIRATSEAERHSIMVLALAGKRPYEIAKLLGLRGNTVSQFLRRRKSVHIAGSLPTSDSPIKKAAGKGKK